MTALRVLIVDDEPLARSSLRRLLSAHDDITIVGECRDGAEAVRAIPDAAAPIDLVFLDVQMPELDGFDVIRAVGPDRMPTTVFVTAFDRFAVRAFDVHALDYLVKPFSDERFEEALERARHRVRDANLLEIGRRMAALVEPNATDLPVQARTSGDSGAAYATRLVVTTGGRGLVIPVATIDWIQADGYYALLHVAGRSHLLRETLNALETRLDPAAFLRVHRSAVVNLDRVRALDRSPDGQLIIVLVDGTRLPVSRSRRERVEATVGYTPRRGA